MRHSDFKIGMKFTTVGSDAVYRVTDIGTRTIVAIRLDASDDSWYNGPPYAVCEIVFDEYEIEVCSSVE